MCTYIATYVQYHCVIINRCNLSSFIALVNKGNCLFSTGQYDKARDYYQEALRFIAQTLVTIIAMYFRYNM